MAIKFAKIEHKADNVQKAKQKLLKNEKKNAAISATRSGGKTPVTLPKMSWD